MPVLTVHPRTVTTKGPRLQELSKELRLKGRHLFPAKQICLIVLRCAEMFNYGNYAVLDTVSSLQYSLRHLILVLGRLRN